MFLRWITCKFLDDEAFFETIIEQLKTVLLTYLKRPDDAYQTKLAKDTPIRFPNNWAKGPFINSVSNFSKFLTHPFPLSAVFSTIHLHF